MSATTSSAPALEIQSIRALNGPNIWSVRPALEMEVDASCFAFDQWDAADELLTSQEIVGTQVEQDTTADARLAFWLGEAVVMLQTAGQTPVSFHAWRAGSAPRIIRLAVEFGEEAIGKAAVEFAVRWLNSLARKEAFDLAAEWEKFRDFAYDARIGNSTGPTVEAAVARGIPFMRLDSESLVQLGHGCRQHRIRRAATDRTSFIAHDISTNKDATKAVLKEVGVPVPRGRAVSDVEDAVLAAREVGWPAVVKPQDADYGYGVTLRIRSEDEIRRAYAVARQHSDGVLVEHHVEGNLYRLLVVGGRLVAAILREPSFVVGDGKRTILELVENASYDPRRGPECVSPFRKMQQETGEMPQLTESPRAHDVVPESGELVLLRHNVYLRCGGVHIDQTEIIHPEIARLAIDATRAVGLDIAGLDVIAQDLRKSPREQEFAVLEVNSEPSIALHLDPLCTPSRPVGEAIVELLFPQPETGRIPVTAVLGTSEDFTAAKQIAQKQRSNGQAVGLAGREGVWLDDHPLGDFCQSAGNHTRRLWRHPRTEAAVVHVTLEDILAEGLPFDRCDELIECPSVAQATAGAGEALSDDRRRARDCARASLTARVPAS